MESLAQQAPATVDPTVPSLGGDELNALEPEGLEDLFFPMEKEEEREVSVSRIPCLELQIFLSCSGMWKVSRPHSNPRLRLYHPTRTMGLHGNGLSPAIVFTWSPPFMVSQALERREFTQVD